MITKDQCIVVIGMLKNGVSRDEIISYIQRSEQFISDRYYVIPNDIVEKVVIHSSDCKKK